MVPARTISEKNCSTPRPASRATNSMTWDESSRGTHMDAVIAAYCCCCSSGSLLSARLTTSSPTAAIIASRTPMVPAPTTQGITLLELEVPVRPKGLLVALEEVALASSSCAIRERSMAGR